MARSSTAENVVDMTENPSTDAPTEAAGSEPGKRTRKASGPRVRNPIHVVALFRLFNAQGEEVNTEGMKLETVTLSRDINSIVKQWIAGTLPAGLRANLEIPGSATDS